MTARERMLVGVTLAAAMCGGVAWGAARLVSARDAAANAAADLADCRRLAATIEARRGTFGETQAVGDVHAKDAGAEVTRRIESAAKSAGLPAGGIERIEPAPLRRVGNGVGGPGASEKPTLVQLRGVTLRQSLAFFHAVTGAGRSPLRLTQVRLSAPSAEDTGDRWAVESTLTYALRSPDGRAASENEE